MMDHSSPWPNNKRPWEFSNDSLLQPTKRPHLDSELPSQNPGGNCIDDYTFSALSASTLNSWEPDLNRLGYGGGLNAVDHGRGEQFNRAHSERLHIDASAGFCLDEAGSDQTQRLYEEVCFGLVKTRFSCGSDSVAKSK